MYYSWHGLNFSVPLKKEEKALLESSEKGEVRINVSKDDPNMKQILSNISGFARPGEMTAIMGASGSGKTSLLNILAQRLDVSRAAKVSGDINCNGKSIGASDFGKLGAFVMQDDIMIETMTPMECFMFAAKLRTNLQGS